MARLSNVVDVFARTLVCAWSFLWCHDAVAAPMAFRLGSDGGTAGNEWIVADGDITPDTPQQFRQFLTGKGIQRGARYEAISIPPAAILNFRSVCGLRPSRASCTVIPEAEAPHAGRTRREAR
jgi:hypothetical protein